VFRRFEKVSKIKRSKMKEVGKVELGTKLNLGKMDFFGGAFWGIVGKRWGEVTERNARKFELGILSRIAGCATQHLEHKAAVRCFVLVEVPVH